MTQESTDRLRAARTSALAANISTRLGACSHDELRVLDRVLAGIEAGRHEYGPLDLARDERDLGAEAAEELRDCLFYLAAAQVAANDRRLERLRCEARDELARTNPVEHGLRELRDSAEQITSPHERFDNSEGG